MKIMLLITGLHNARVTGKLLLALHLRLGIGKHDPSLRRAESFCPLPDPRVPQPVRVHGPDDNVQKSGLPGIAQVRGNAELGPKQNTHKDFFQTGRQVRVQVRDGATGAGPEAVQNIPAGPDKGSVALQGHKEREDLGDAHVPGQFGDVPHPGQLPGSLPAEASETRLQVL